MQLKFRHKVFLAFIINSLVIVCCMLLIVRYFAHHDFEDYVSKVEMERLNELADSLGQKYQKSKNWDAVLTDWHQRLDIPPIGPGQHSGDFHHIADPVFPPPAPPSMERHPKKEEPPPYGDPPGPPQDSWNIPPHVSLFDADKRPLTRTESASADGYRLKPIMVEGQRVGWLGIRGFRGPTRPLDLEFIRNQSRTFYSTGGVALMLAVLVTIVLSRHLLSPVKELAKGTRALTSRRFDTRIEVRSRDEFGQLATDFNAMAQALEKYEQMRRQWIADISHELRTPLSILRGEIEAMQDGVRSVTPSALESLHFEVLHVSRIVHDLHDLSLIESRDFFDAEQTAVNPLEVLEETLKSFKSRFEKRGIRIEAEKGDMKHVEILADPGRLTQLFSNLFMNTLRYAHAPGMLKISHELTSESLYLHFEDSGPGVPEESLDHLFDRLYRVDKARSRDQGGSGLGLAICKSIVEGFGGRIKAANVPFSGLRITIIFPVSG
ncbi:MAG: HAMP domain-containing protein [Deltaproteobacteria bacterium]|nr:HAMP domain-containing protein [Deltaproteobacteria bacterium]